MTKKLFALIIMSILLCGCGNIETDTANQAGDDAAEVVTEAPTIANSEYLDTSDITYSGVFSQDMEVGYDVEGDAGQSIVQFFDEYTSPDGETFAFDEYKRLRYYFNHNLEDDTKASLPKDEMQAICDNVLSDFIDGYENYECEDTITTSGESIAYRSMMRYKTDSVNYGANIALTPSGKIKYLNIYYYERADESQIDHEYFDFKFEEKINEIKERSAVHHYEIEKENYYLKDDSVFALYKVMIYSTPIYEGSDEYITFTETFGFAKTLE
ncbi:MAG: hypothetical protein E7497_02445 [Ruminococcus sp.]|nr:hypothetical protein [Ruminococcus sp.]